MEPITIPTDVLERATSGRHRDRGPWRVLDETYADGSRLVAVHDLVEVIDADLEDPGWLDLAGALLDVGERDRAEDVVRDRLEHLIEAQREADLRIEAARSSLLDRIRAEEIEEALETVRNAWVGPPPEGEEIEAIAETVRNAYADPPSAETLEEIGHVLPRDYTDALLERHTRDDLEGDDR